MEGIFLFFPFFILFLVRGVKELKKEKMIWKKNRGIAIIALVSILIAGCPAVTVAQSTPFVTYGETFDSDDVKLDNCTVTVTNMDTDEKWNAETSATSNYYQLMLKNSSEVKEDDTLLIVACKNISTYEHNCNVTNRTVTEDGINAGGFFNYNLSLNHYCLNWYPRYPFYPWEQQNWSGPAVMEMCIDNYRDPPYVPNQTELNETGIGNNYVCNADLPFVDTQGMWMTLNHYLHAYDGQPRVANYYRTITSDLNSALHYICWYQSLGPGVAPAYGDYSNWMVVRGLHTNVSPRVAGYYGYDIYGFWINDPNPTGIGENTYKSVDQWTDTYYKPLTGVNASDPCKGKYVAVCEPPGHDAEVRLVRSPARFSAQAVESIQAARTLQAVQSQTAMGTDIKTMAEVIDIDVVVVEEANKWIVKAAIDGANEQLVPHDREFAAVFANTIADEPLFVNSDTDTGDYYLVPFADASAGSYKSWIEKLDEMIADLETMNGDDPVRYGDRIQSLIAETKSLREDLNTDRSVTMVVVIVNAVDGCFKEASWVNDPVEYLPVSKEEALEIAGKSGDGATAELVYQETSPYYPVWRIMVGSSVYYVNQEGELFDADGDGDGYMLSEGDCNDNHAAIYPGAPELCDRLDNDCDGEVDEGCPTPTLIPIRSGPKPIAI
jgi:hypothetical protein